MRSTAKDFNTLVEVSGLVGPDGVLMWGMDYVPSRTAVGVYVLRFPKLKYIQAISVETGNVAGCFTAGTVPSPNVANVYMWAAGTLAPNDMAFTFQVQGVLL